MNSEEQILLWVKGKSIHNKERDECCPDFSCCRPELLAPLGVRQLFYNAHIKGKESVTNRLLMEFLGKAFADENVHIAGLELARREGK